MKKQVVKVFNKGTNDLPNYSTEFAAGFDIRADLSRINQFSDLMGNDSLSLTIPEDGSPKVITLFPKGGRVLIPTGLHISIPDNYELQIRPRSGLALKNGITIMNSPGTIDCFSEDSSIKSINGDINIKDLKINDVVLSVNENLEIEKDIITAIIDKGVLEINIIETEDGILEITDNTLVYTDRGLIKAIELKENDNILHF